MPPMRVSVDEVKSWMDQERAPAFVDARSPEAFAKGTESIPNSIRIPPDEAESRVDDVPRGRAVVAYCT